jgi:hypothetical protein
MPEDGTNPTGPPDGTYTAVLDRYEGDHAVFVIEADGQDIGEAAIMRDSIPDDARTVDTVVELTVVRGVPTTIETRPEETAERTDRTQDRFDRLSRRRGGE